MNQGNLIINLMEKANKQDINNIKAKEARFFSKDWLPIPTKTLTMISAPGGTGKSFLSIQLAIRIIAENPNHKVLLWLSEDPIDIIKDRIDKIFNRIIPHLLEKKEKILKQIKIISAEDPTAFFNELNEKELKEIGDKLVTINYNVIILDPLIAFYSGEENSNSQVRRFMNILNRITQERLLSIVLIHHHNKNSDGARTRGASAFVDAVRLLYTLNTIKTNDKEIHPTKRLIRIEKDNWGVRQLLNTSELEKEILPYNITIKNNIKEEENEY